MIRSLSVFLANSDAEAPVFTANYSRSWRLADRAFPEDALGSTLPYPVPFNLHALDDKEDQEHCGEVCRNHCIATPS